MSQYNAENGSYLLNSITNQYEDMNDELASLSSLTNVRASVQQYKKLVDENNNQQLSDLLTRKQPKFTPQAPRCAKCDKSVYKAEEIRAANKTFHKLCFKCNQCNKLLEPNILTERQGDLYCKNCYAKMFGPKGYGYGGGAGVLSTDTITTSPVSLNNSPAQNNNHNNSTTPANVIISANTPSSLRASYSSSQNNHYSNSPISTNSSSSWIKQNSSSNLNNNNNIANSPRNSTHISSAFNHEKKANSGIQYGGSDKCARCQKAVYAAEKVVAASKSYHKLCFTCFTCKKMLNSMTCCDNSDGEIFCKSCYGRQYGPKGVGYGIGAGTLSTN